MTNFSPKLNYFSFEVNCKMTILTNSNVNFSILIRVLNKTRCLNVKLYLAAKCILTDFCCCKKQIFNKLRVLQVLKTETFRNSPFNRLCIFKKINNVPIHGSPVWQTLYIVFRNIVLFFFCLWLPRYIDFFVVTTE